MRGTNSCGAQLLLGCPQPLAAQTRTVANVAQSLPACVTKREDAARGEILRFRSAGLGRHRARGRGTTDPSGRGPSLPGAARLYARGEAVPVSPDEGGLPRRGRQGCPTRHYGPQEEVRAAQDEVKQLKRSSRRCSSSRQAPQTKTRIEDPGPQEHGHTLTTSPTARGFGTMIPSTGRGGRRRGGRSAAARLRSGGIGSWWTRRSPRRI